MCLPTQVLVHALIKMNFTSVEIRLNIFFTFVKQRILYLATVSVKTPDCRQCRRESKCEILRVAFHAKRWRSYAVDIFLTGNPMKEMLQKMTLTLLDNFHEKDNMGSIQTKLLYYLGIFPNMWWRGLLNLLMSIYQLIFGLRC